MSIYEKIEELLYINTMKINELARLSGVPNTTIYSLKRRNSNKINLEALEKIAKVLGVTINYFMSGEPLGDSIILSPEETEFILKLRLLDEHGLKVMNNLLECEVERAQRLVEVKVDISAEDEGESKIVAVDINELKNAFNELE